jgi:hypothetical protein
MENQEFAHRLRTETNKEISRIKQRCEEETR